MAAARGDSLSIEVVHDTLPGRTRVRIAGLHRSPTLATRLRQRLAGIDGVHAARISALTGCVLLHHAGLDRAQLLRILSDPGRTDESPAPRPCSPDVETCWHGRSVNELQAEFGVDARTGLSSEEASVRFARCGPNRLSTITGEGALHRLAGQFTTVPVSLLTGSAALSLATRAPIDAAVTLGVVLVNAAIGFLTENGAAALIARFCENEQQCASVLRAGRQLNVDAEALVPGDILLVHPGDPVPADARVLEAEHLSVDESLLTGESLPQRKQAQDRLPAGTTLGDRCNMLHQGTTVSGGSGRALVVATGDATELGRVQRMAGSAVPPRTPIEGDLDQLGKELALGALGIAGVAFGLGVLRGHPPMKILTSAIALAVAAVPEGLPAVATSTLALGLGRLQRQRLLVRKLGAVEALGSADYLCLDKTGTLTENRMRVVRAAHESGEWRREDSNPQDLPWLAQLLEIAVLASEQPLEQGDDGISGSGASGTERAIAELAGEVDRGRALLAVRFRNRRVRYRDEAHNFVVAAYETHEGGCVAMKGQPNEVLAQCSHGMGPNGPEFLTAARRREIERMNERFGAAGLRVLGCAFSTEDDRIRERYESLIWCGLLGLMDPIRPNTTALIERFHRAGVRTLMITGDQAPTAVKVGEALQLAGDEPLQVLDAAAMAELPPEMLAALAERTHVFARISPARKLEIVQALQRAGHCVVMTGDGINDGPALRAADVGIAMGRDGTRVARDVADIVIEDDDLEHILTGIAEGRTILSNIRKAIHFLLATNLSEILVVFFEVLRGPREVESPMELFWINLVTDIFPALGLALEPREPGVLDAPPRNTATPLTDTAYYRRLAMESAIIAGCALSAHGYGLARYGPGARTRSLTFFSLVSAQLLHAVNCRSDRFHFTGVRDWFTNPALASALGLSFALQILPAGVPALRRLLRLAPVSKGDVAIIAATSLAAFAGNELLLARVSGALGTRATYSGTGGSHA